MADFRNQSTDRMLGLGALAVVMAGCLLVLFPFVTALLLAVILTFSTWPLYARLRHVVGGKNTVSDALMMLAAILYLLAPSVFVQASTSHNHARLIDDFYSHIHLRLPALPS